LSQVLRVGAKAPYETKGFPYPFKSYSLFSTFLLERSLVGLGLRSHKGLDGLHLTLHSAEPWIWTSWFVLLCCDTRVSFPTLRVASKAWLTSCGSVFSLTLPRKRYRMTYNLALCWGNLVTGQSGCIWSLCFKPTTTWLTDHFPLAWCNYLPERWKHNQLNPSFRSLSA
jgi:hypothetical protein